MLEDLTEFVQSEIFGLKIAKRFPEQYEDITGENRVL